MIIIEGPLISISRNSILMIRYADGRKDIMNLDNKIQSKEIYDAENPSSSLGFLSILCGLFSWAVLAIIFAPAGIVFGIISLVRYENKVLGIIGLIISSIAFVILLAALSL